MIRLSRLADYAVVLMARMTARPEHVHNAFDLAALTGLPVPTVSKVLAKLGRGGLLQSQRGARGGYMLARPADSISVADIVAALDGPIALTNCIQVGARKSCEVEIACPSRHGINRINAALRQALEDVTLAEIAAPPPLAAAPAATPATVPLQ